ncbi:MAG: hypothetical protein JST92_22165 [Deltaproteobacteria bacterium]|nr:hypothetical protein [Deltaproteobacteria bacterium]
MRMQVSGLSFLALAVLATGCIQQQTRNTGKAHVIASGNATLAGIDHIGLTVSKDDNSLTLARQLSFGNGVWQVTLTELPVGGYTFHAIAYTSTDDSAAAFEGEADNVQILASQTALVNIVMHSLSGPVTGAGPIIDSVTASTMTPQENEQVSLTVTAHSPSGLTLSYLWTAQSGSFGNESAQTTQQNPQWQAPREDGPVQLVIKVTDTNGSSASLAFSLVVIPTNGSATVNVWLPPEIDNIAGEQDAQDAGTWAISLDVTPADQNPLAFQWTVDDGCPGESFFSDATAQSPIFHFGGIGDCTLTVTVSEVNDALPEAPTSVATLTLSNTNTIVQFGPSITAGSQSLVSANAGQTVVFDIEAQDHNSPAQDLTYNWSFTDGSSRDETTNTAFTWNAPGCFKAGGSQITVAVSNDALTTSQTFTVKGTPLCPDHAFMLVVFDTAPTPGDGFNLGAPGHGEYYNAKVRGQSIAEGVANLVADVTQFWNTTGHQLPGLEITATQQGPNAVLITATGSAYGTSGNGVFVWGSINNVDTPHDTSCLHFEDLAGPPDFASISWPSYTLSPNQAGRFTPGQ